MKIRVDLTRPQSLQNAIKRIRDLKSRFKNMMSAFLEDVANEVIKIANNKVMDLDIGDEVKRDIMGGWYIDKSENGLRVYNTVDKAVYVEFGVGYEGGIKEHPQASIEGYRYGIGEKINPNTNIWIFNVESDDEIDITNDYIIRRGKTSVSTRGQPASLFVYNALLDIKTSGKIDELWIKNCKRYLN